MSMIRIEVAETGDTAYAETPEAALLAARTIGQEAKDHARTQGFDPTLRFATGDYEADEWTPVRTVSLRELNR